MYQIFNQNTNFDIKYNEWLVKVNGGRTEMNNIKKGDIVVRKSHNRDIIFIVDLIINNKIAILSGLTARLKADSDIDDLEKVEKKVIQKLGDRVDIVTKQKYIPHNRSKIIYTGRILHLDGDKRYSEKSSMYYKKMGLTAIVKNIPESRQVVMANDLITRYKPDIVVVTGHDRNDKIREKLWRYI